MTLHQQRATKRFECQPDLLLGQSQGEVESLEMMLEPDRHATGLAAKRFEIAPWMLIAGGLVVLAAVAALVVLCGSSNPQQIQ